MSNFIDNRIPKQIALTTSNIVTFNVTGLVDTGAVIIDLTEEQRRSIANKIGRDRIHFTSATIVKQ